MEQAMLSLHISLQAVTFNLNGKQITNQMITIVQLIQLSSKDVYFYVQQVGKDVLTKETAKNEMLEMAGDEKNLILVKDYNALGLILSKLETNILSGIEGGSKTISPAKNTTI